MGKIFRWLDHNLWAVPILIFLAATAALGGWSAASNTPVLLAAAPPTSRQQVYGSLTGSSSALLALALAAVAILAAFSPRPSRPGQPGAAEASLARSRANLAGSLLVASFFLLVILVTATAAIAIDSAHVGNMLITTIVEASGSASTAGLLISGVGLALVIAERSRP